ncbi:MAG: alpha/beta fold hydrolase [Ruminococcaceae bacterium]|nr:alpha/beta fold hydrolase [Oscillospiraceae bacterium]
MKIVEGYMPFKGFQTYYRIVGEATPGKAPLLCLHGGPGSTHNYFEVLDCLAEDGRQIISYDQIGCGNSYIEGHPELFTNEVWQEELVAIREHLGLDEVHLLGQSWGGMLEIAYMADKKPEGVKSLIISSGHCSSSLWAAEQHRNIKFMSQEDQDAIKWAEEHNDFTRPEYLEADRHFAERHIAGKPGPDAPECLTRPKKSGREAYLVGWGPNEYTPSGTLKDFEYTHTLKDIKVPCLVVSGTDDICTPLVAKTMYDEIPNSRWELFVGCRHTCFVEDNERYVKMMLEWLNEND